MALIFGRIVSDGTMELDQVFRYGGDADASHIVVDRDIINRDIVNRNIIGNHLEISSRKPPPKFVTRENLLTHPSLNGLHIRCVNRSRMGVNGLSRPSKFFTDTCITGKILL